MATISNALLTNMGSGASTLAGLNSSPNANSTTSAGQVSQSTGQEQTTYTPSAANQPASLTYSSTGTIPPAPQTQASAQAAYLAAEAAITQAMADMMSGAGTSGSSGTDIFGAGTSSSTTNDPTGSLNNLPAKATSSSVSAATDAKAQAAQKAYVATQDAVTKSLGSLKA